MRDSAPTAADQSKSGLAVRYLRGVGPAREAMLHKLGIDTVQDLLFFFPRRYEDRRHIEKIVRLRPSDRPTTVYGVVRASGVSVSPKQHAKI